MSGFGPGPGWGGSTATQVTPGGGAGTGATAALAAGSTDSAGQIDVTTGADAAVGAFASVVFGAPLTATPRAVIVMGGTGANGIKTMGITAKSATGFTIRFASAPVVSAVNSVQYLVIP